MLIRWNLVNSFKSGVIVIILVRKNHFTITVKI